MAHFLISMASTVDLLGHSRLVHSGAIPAESGIIQEATQSLEEIEQITGAFLQKMQGHQTHC